MTVKIHEETNLVVWLTKNERRKLVRNKSNEENVLCIV